MSTSLEKIPVTIGSVTYGTGQLVETPMNVPEGFGVLASTLCANSKLLHFEGVVSKKSVLDAYGTDLGLMRRYEQDLHTLIQVAIRSTIRPDLCEVPDNKLEDAIEKLFGVMRKELPPFAMEENSPFTLDYKLAARGPQEILTELKKRFQQGVGAFMRRFDLYLQQLVNLQIFGLIEWEGDDACRFHFFEHARMQKTTVSRQQKVSGNWLENVEKITTVSTDILTRRSQDLALARVWELADYQRPVPARIRNFANAVPLSLRSLLSIVDGTKVRESVATRQSSEEAVTTTTRSLYRYDPVVALGGIVLTGWDPDEVEPETQAVRMEKIARALEEEEQRKERRVQMLKESFARRQSSLESVMNRQKNEWRKWTACLVIGGLVMSVVAAVASYLMVGATIGLATGIAAFFLRKWSGSNTRKQYRALCPDTERSVSIANRLPELEYIVRASQNKKGFVFYKHEGPVEIALHQQMGSATYFGDVLLLNEGCILHALSLADGQLTYTVSPLELTKD